MAATGRGPRVPLAKPSQVAEYLQLDEKTLQNWRSLGKGPKYRPVGREVRYEWADVDAWWNAQPAGPAGSASAA